MIILQLSSMLKGFSPAVKPQRGLTLMELAVVIAVIIVLSAFAVATVSGLDESADARLVESVQASLQSAVTQGSVRLDIPPLSLNPQNVINATSLPDQANPSGTKPYRLTGGSMGSLRLVITRSQRGAVFGVTSTGDVRISSLINFSPSYGIRNGTIHKFP